MANEVITMDNVDVDRSHVQAAERPDHRLDADYQGKPFVRSSRENVWSKAQR